MGESDGQQHNPSCVSYTLIWPFLFLQFMSLRAKEISGWRAVASSTSSSSRVLCRGKWYSQITCFAWFWLFFFFDFFLASGRANESWKFARLMIHWLTHRQADGQSDGRTDGLSGELTVAMTPTCHRTDIAIYVITRGPAISQSDRDPQRIAPRACNYFLLNLHHMCNMSKT